MQQQSRGRLTCFAGHVVMEYGQDVMRYKLLYEMIIFFEVIGNWQEPYGCRFIVCNAIAM